MSTTTLPAPRTERLFGATPTTENQLKSKVKDFLRDVSCPACQGIMTLVKAPIDPDGFQTVTYQCHNPHPTKANKMCLGVWQYTDSAQVYLRPGDFDNGDIGWKQAAKEIRQTMPMKDVEELVTAKKINAKAAFDGVKIKPEYPGHRETLNKVIWEYFWTYIMTRGKVEKEKLDEFVIRQKGSNPKTAEALRTVASMITTRTGYAVKLSGGFYEVTGRTVGGNGPTAEPYSTEAYKLEHGFPLS